MISCELERDQYNALIACTATKKDVRIYLRGIHINHKDKQFEASDGTKLIIVKTENMEGDQTCTSAIFQPTKKAPFKTNLVKIEYSDENTLIKFIDNNGQLFETLICNNIDNVFPDVKRVIPIECDVIDKNQVYFNAALVNDAVKEFKNKPLQRWNIYKNQLVCRSIENVIIVVMCGQDE